jgi:hypothetical protein
MPPCCIFVARHARMRVQLQGTRHSLLQAGWGAVGRCRFGGTPGRPPWSRGRRMRFWASLDTTSYDRRFDSRGGAFTDSGSNDLSPRNLDVRPGN